VVGEEVRIEASARSFLHNQVRSMVGSLKLVGESKWGPHDMGTALLARDRAACGPVAPARGLYLVRVDYAAAPEGLKPRMAVETDAGEDGQE
jgi:tRNA pseudouridine38-40 synthase